MATKKKAAKKAKKATQEEEVSQALTASNMVSRGPAGPLFFALTFPLGGHVPGRTAAPDYIYIDIVAACRSPTSSSASSTRRRAPGTISRARSREELDPAWSAGFSQIYPALARLRRHGWVLLRVLGPRRGPRATPLPGDRRRPPGAPAAGSPSRPRRPAATTSFSPGSPSSTPCLPPRGGPPSRRWPRRSRPRPPGSRRCPTPGGSRGLARRAAAAERRALRQFLESGGVDAPAAPVRRKRCFRTRRAGGRMIASAREEAP